MKETLVKIKLSDVKPNPNRDLAFNPYNEEKIAALMASIGETGFWTNVIVRQSPDGKGYEQAYGHHRIESARRCDIKEADFVVRELDENMMLKMMELENQEDYRYCPLSLLESVKAVVKALAEGRIPPFYKVEDGTLPPEGHPDRYKGTKPSGKKWIAQYSPTSGTEHLGTFETKEAAAKAYRIRVKGLVVLQGTGSEVVRYAPGFIPKNTCSTDKSLAEQGRYIALDIAKFLGRAQVNVSLTEALENVKDNASDEEQVRTATEYLGQLQQKDDLSYWKAKAKGFLSGTFVRKNDGKTIRSIVQADPSTNTVLDALYLLEVKAIKTSDIKDMNWSQLGKFVADIKQRRERVILRETYTKEEIVKINAESQRIQAEQKEQERKAEDERKALVKKLAEAKKEEDTKKAKEIRDKLDAQDEATAKAEETFKEKNKVLDAKVQQVKQHEAEAKEADKYLPIRKEADRIVHKLERRDEEAEIKALARRALNANDRERLRQAALKLGEWYNTWVADLFLPPLSTKSSLAEYRNREEAKRRAESKENK
jgi:hypothetical protein